MSVDVSVGPVALQLAPSHMPCVGALSLCLAAQQQSGSDCAAGRSGNEYGRGDGGAGLSSASSARAHPDSRHDQPCDGPVSSPGEKSNQGGLRGGGGGGEVWEGEEEEGEGAWGRSSLFADLVAPNYEDLVKHLLQPCLVSAKMMRVPLCASKHRCPLPACLSQSQEDDGLGLTVQQHASAYAQPYLATHTCFQNAEARILPCS